MSDVPVAVKVPAQSANLIIRPVNFLSIRCYGIRGFGGWCGGAFGVGLLMTAYIKVGNIA